MKLMQEFHLKQENHEIRFWAYDIESIEKITPYNLSRIFIPECSERDCYEKGCGQKNIPEICCQCYSPHLQELLLDGWYVGDKNGFLSDDCYVAKLQTGIRVPVPKAVYDAWKDGFTKEHGTSGDGVYEL